MEPLSEELVDETWKEIADYTPEMGYEESVAVSKSQPEILSFIVEMTEDLDEDIRELAVYMFFAIHRMFQRGYGKPIDSATADEIIYCYESNERLMESMGGTDDQFFEQIAEVQMSSQPYVIRYVVESLFEAGQGDDPVLPAEEDLGYLFFVMKTVIDVLNMKTDD